MDPAGWTGARTAARIRAAESLDRGAAMGKPLSRYGGIAASIILIAFGIGAVL